MANNAENNAVQSVTQEIIGLPEIDSQEKDFLTELLRKIRSEKMSDSDKEKFFRLYQKYKEKINTQNIDIRKALEDLADNVENTTLLESEVKPLLLYHALEKNKMNKDFFEWNEIHLKTLNSHFANLINQLNIQKYNIGQVYRIPGKDSFEKWKKLQEMILPEKSNNNNNAENSKYNLAACIMLILILTEQRDRIARNDLDRIRLLEEGNNPLLPLMENASWKSPEERNKYFMELPFSELLGIMVGAKMKKSWDVAKRIAKSASNSIWWWEKLMWWLWKKEKQESEDWERSRTEWKEIIREETKDIISSTLDYLKISEEERKTINTDKVINYLLNDAWLCTVSDVRPPMQWETPSEKKLIETILDQKNIDTENGVIFWVNLHTVLNDENLEKKFWELWKSHATTEDILKLKSIMQVEAWEEPMDSKISEFALLIYIEQFFSTHNFKPDAGTIEGKIENKAIDETSNILANLKELSLTDRSAAIAYEELYELIDATKSWKNKILESKWRWLLYVGLLFKAIELITLTKSIHSSINRNFKPWKYRKYLKFLNIIVPGSSVWLNSKIQSESSRKIQELEKHKAELEKKMQSWETSQDLLAEIEGLKRELSELKKADFLEKIEGVEENIEGLRKRVSTLTAEDLSKPELAEEISSIVEKIQSQIERVAEKMSPEDPARLKLQEMREKFDFKGDMKVVLEHLHSIRENIDEHIRPDIDIKRKKGWKK